MFAIQGKPGWASFDDRTGTLSGAPGVADVGSSGAIVISVSDGKSTASLQAFTIAVSPAANRAPRISGTPDTLVSSGSNYAFKPTAIDDDGDFLTFEISGKPRWATFDAATGQLSGTPDNSDAGTVAPIVITVTDGRLRASLAGFSITVQPVLPPAPPNVNAGSSAGTSSSGGSVPAGSSTPAGNSTASINPSPPSGTTTSSGSASSSTAGSTTSSTSSGSLNPAPATTTPAAAPSNQAPRISGVPPSSVDAGSRYAFQPTADDADGDRLTFAIQNRPTWATFDTATGSLSGTPTRADSGFAGPIEIVVSDGKSSAALPSFTIRVNATNRAPSISGSPARQVEVGTTYSFTPASSDADGDRLSFSIAGRPSWAAFDVNSGRISGTPKAGDVGTTSSIVITASDGIDAASLPPFSITVEAANHAPSLAGSPATSIVAGQAYDYTPQASDPDSDPLTFTIANKPRWATFDPRSGRLAGTPLASDTGVYAGITISVSDGRAATTSAAFSINVQSASTGIVTLTWQAPTTNTDGSALSDLAGYRLRYGKAPGTLDQVLDIGNSGLTSFVLDGLTSGTWYFALRAYNRSGTESPPSNIAARTLP